jgi:curli biogenesis system outer membrane secretion channel CsgG
MKTATAVLLALTAALTACSHGAPPPAPAEVAAQPAKPLPKSNVFSSDVNALNKAKNVQNVVNDQQKAADKALKDQGG